MRVRPIILSLTAAPFLMAHQAPPATPADQARRAGNAHQIVCRKFPPPTGTRIFSQQRKICKTNAEWQMMDREIFDSLDRVQRKPYQ